MPVKDPGRIPVGLFRGERLSDDAVRRLSAGAARIIAFAEGDAAASISDQWARVAPGVEVDLVGGVSDIRAAVIEAARRKVIWVGAPAPRNVERFVRRALQGAAAATEFDVPSVAVHVLRDEIPEGPVAWLTQTGEMSGYGVLYAAAMAAMSGRSVTLVEPTALQAPRTPEAAEAAERYIEQSGIEVERISDPSPIVRVLGGSFGAIVHPVLDAPGGRSLLHPGELPDKSVASGNAAAVVELIEKAPGDVIAVFDGVQLVYGGNTAAKVAASVALGVTALTGVGAMAAPAAMAAPPPHSAHVTGNRVAVNNELEGVGLQVVASDHSHGSTVMTVSNHGTDPVSFLVFSGHGHHGGSGASAEVTLQPGQDWSGSFGGGIKQFTITAAGQTATATGTTGPGPDGGATGHETPPHEPVEVTGQPGQTLTGYGPVGTQTPGPEGHSQVPTPIPTPTPTQVPPKPDTPDIQVTPINVPPIVGYGPVGTQTPGPEGHSQVPTPIPTPTPTATPSSVQPTVTPETATETGTPDAGTTGTGTTTPAGTVTPQAVPTTHAATREGGTTHHEATRHDAEHAPTATVAGGPGQLAHTGAGETGLIAGFAAVLMAAGAGLAVAARRNRDDRDESVADLTT